MKSNKILSSISAAAALMASEAKTMGKDILTIAGDESFPASAISNTHKVPTGRARLMHAIKLGKENYHYTTNGKRLPKKHAKSNK